MSEYFVLLLLVISIPLLLSFEKRIRYYRYWPALFGAIILTMIPFILWDILFTQDGVWHFNSRYTSSVYISGLPLEEWLFFIAIPFSCMYIYILIKYATNNYRSSFPGGTPGLFYSSGILFIIFALFFYEKSYTMIVFGTFGLTLVMTGYKKFHFFWNYFITFLITMIPFFLVNGYLTSKPVVIYDNAQILGARLLTIPVEDVFYSYILLFMNTWLFEKFSRNESDS